LVAQGLEIPIRFRPHDEFQLFDWENLKYPPPEPVVHPDRSCLVGFLEEVSRETPVCLDGLDGDTLLKRQLDRYWGELARAGRWSDGLRAAAWYVRHQKRPPPLGLRARLRRWLGRGEHWRDTMPPWLAPDFVRRAALEERWRQFSQPPADAAAWLAHRLAGPQWQRVFNR